MISERTSRRRGLRHRSTPRAGSRRARTITAVLAAATIGATTAAPPASAHVSPAGLLDAFSRTVTQNLSQRGISDTVFDVPSYLWMMTHPRGSGTQNLPRDDQKTMCRTVVQIGDSTSVGLDNSVHLPSPTDRMTPQYQRVGVKNVYLNALNFRSTVERYNGEPSGLDAIKTELSRHHDGCWIIALGANDAARIATGSPVTADQRIDNVMRHLIGRPVLWPTVMTTDTKPATYAKSYMTAFNAALQRAAHRYPNLRVFDFARYPDPSWYVDGVHYTVPGMIQRNRLFATALATEFPQRP